MLTLQFVPYHEIESLVSEDRIKKLLGLVKENKIVLLQGRLKFIEETKLIESTMEEINATFRGIEICTIYPKKRTNTFYEILKNELVKTLLGEREGLTIIGPATLIKEIKRDPNKVLLLATEMVKKTKKKR